MSSDRIGLDQAFVQREEDEVELAAVAFLACYSGRTLAAYRQDLRFFFAWTASVGLEVLTATRPHIHADPRTTTIDDRRRESFDRHAAYVVDAFVAGA